MKNKTFKILITALIAITTTCVSADTLTQNQLENAIKTQVKNSAQKQISSLGGGEVVVKIMNLPYGDIETKNKAQIRVESNQNTFAYRDIKRVSIYDGETFVRSFPVSVNTLVYKNVLSATNPIAIGQSINVSNSTLNRVEVGQYLNQTIDTTPSISLVAQRNISKGSAILNNYVKSKPDVIKDTTVNIIFSSNNNLKITVDGKALKEGSVGDNIPVRSFKYNKIYQATISDKNEVTIKI